MDSIQVKMVLAVARNKSFSAAARELAYSQSTVSKRIGALENELGVRLFERKARAQVVLTEAGRRLLPDFEALERDGALLVLHAADMKEHAEQKLRIGCLSGWSTFGEDEIIIGFTERNPGSSIEQVVGSMPFLLDLLMTRRLDGLFVALAEPRERLDLGEGYRFQDIWDLRLKIACSESHPAAGRGCASLVDFKDDLFLFRKARSTREDDVKLRCFIDACASEGFTPEIEYVDVRPSMAFGMVSSGLCVAPLMFKPKTVRPGVRLMRLDKDYYHFSVKFVYHADNDSELLARFVRFLQRHRSPFGVSVRDE
ncbi:MAG TPA: LysR family transcriptional regulator [Candidatus Aphodovivens avistercoris]|nr:LysR family transcriptional regulator [Candidatus Aphodovivens avistercoris]